MPFHLHRSTVVLAALAALTTPACSRAHASPSDPSPTDASTGRPGFAVVELFTSEGCSSCPPADELLRDLAGDIGDGDIYALSFHVDYWNDLGWVDPFSTESATSRQTAYARVLGGRGLYTPQMIVNGRDAFVGSDRAHARRSIDRALGQGSPLQLGLHVKPATHPIAVDFDLSAAPPAGAVLELALVEASATSVVKAGENAGRTLRHSHVVRAFRTVPLAGLKGHAVLTVPAGFAVDRGEIVGYVQDSGTMIIRAASRARL